MLNQQPFLLLPARFLLFGLLLYVSVELMGASALQYIPNLQGQEQTVIILMRLFELFGFIFLIHYFQVVQNLGLAVPKQKDFYIFSVISICCVVVAGLLFLFQPAGLLYMVLPVWLQGITGLLLMVVLAPIVEELVFRGLLYRMLRERWGIAISVGVSAVFFSMVHHGMIISPQLVGGIIFALAYEWSKSLWVSIGLHMGANAAVYMLAMLGLAA